MTMTTFKLMFNSQHQLILLIPLYYQYTYLMTLPSPPRLQDGGMITRAGWWWGEGGGTNQRFNPVSKQQWHVQQSSLNESVVGVGRLHCRVAVKPYEPCRWPLNAFFPTL